MEQSITASTSSNNFNGSNDFQMGELKLNEVTSKNPAKKKRKQMVACDSCRTRRVKCDRSERFELGITECTECANKEINCTDSYIKGKPKVVRKGKLIVEAKRLYGARDDSIDINGGDSRKIPSPDVIRNSEAKLVEQEAAKALSNHLIEIYIKMVNPQTPIINTDKFLEHWNKAGRDTTALSPTFEVLALVMQAFASRFSDHETIVGKSSPSLANMRESPIQDYSAYGRQRDSFCRALAAKASRAVDENGTLRSASYASTGALLLLEFLLSWDESYRTTGRHLMTAAIEHLRTIAEGHNVESQEADDSDLTGGPLFWMAFCRDSNSAALGGRSACLTDTDIPTLCALASYTVLIDVRTLVTSDNPQSLNGLAFVAAFNSLARGIRAFALQVSGPLARRAYVNSAFVHAAWAKIVDESENSLLLRESILRNKLADSDVPSQWYRDLATTRCKFALAIHINLSDRLAIEESKAGEYRSPSEIETLEDLKIESDARFLITIQELMVLLTPCGTGLLFYSSLTSEYLPIYLSHVISILPLEHGGTNVIWTIAKKMELIQDMLQVLKLLSWSWGYYDTAIEEGALALEKLQYQNSPTLRAQSQTRSIDQSYQNPIPVKLSQYAPNSQARSALPPQQTPAHFALPDPLLQAQIATALLLAPSRGTNLPNSYTTEEWINNNTSVAPLSSDTFTEIISRQQEHSATVSNQSQCSYLSPSNETNQFPNSYTRPHVPQEYSTSDITNSIQVTVGQYNAPPYHPPHQPSN